MDDRASEGEGVVREPAGIGAQCAPQDGVVAHCAGWMGARPGGEVDAAAAMSDAERAWWAWWALSMVERGFEFEIGIALWRENLVGLW